MKHYQKPDGSVWAFDVDGSQDHLITEDMTPCDAPVISPPPLSPLQQIRALEEENADDQARMMRQVCIESTLVQACARPEASGLSRAQVHTLLMAQGKGYTKLVMLEQQIAALRDQLP